MRLRFLGNWQQHKPTLAAVALRFSAFHEVIVNGLQRPPQIAAFMPRPA